MRPWMIAPLAAMMLSACQSKGGEPVTPDPGDPTTEGANPVAAPLEFAWEVAQQGDYLERPEVTVTAVPGGVRIESRLSAPDPCRRLAGEVRRAGRGVSLHVTVHPPERGTMCAAVVGSYVYSASIGGLDPGAYTLRVVHDYPETGWPSGAVLESSITVR